MSLIFSGFALLFFVTLILYYALPARFSWWILLAASFVFFSYNSKWQLILYLLFSITVAYIAARIINQSKQIKIKKIALWCSVVLLIGQLFVLKDLNFFVITANLITELFNNPGVFNAIDILAPIGVSYYTLSILGYVIDVYREEYDANKNFFQVALFACYFPQLTSGPISDYGTISRQMFNRAPFNFNTLVFGLERILWGYMKKLILADRLSLIVTQVFNVSDKNTVSILIGSVAYAFQLYADFSGCMDIVMGVSECFGITLPENFDAPFFSKTISEFWRRWHITLGVWFRSYLFYPLLRTKPFIKLNRSCKKTFKGKLGRIIPTQIALFVLWFAVGLWHGGSYRYIMASGMLPFIYLLGSDLLEPIFSKMRNALKINTESIIYHLFASARTMFLMLLCWILVCSENLSIGFTNIFSLLNFTGLSLPPMPTLSFQNAVLIVLGMLALAIAEFARYNNKSIRIWLSERNVVLRCSVLWLACIITIFFGNFNASSFIYFQF